MECLKAQVPGPHSRPPNLTLGPEDLPAFQLHWWFWSPPKPSLPCCRILTGRTGPAPQGPHLHALVSLFWKLLELSANRFRSEQALETDADLHPTAPNKSSVQVVILSFAQNANSSGKVKAPSVIYRLVWVKRKSSDSDWHLVKIISSSLWFKWREGLFHLSPLVKTGRILRRVNKSGG